MPTFTYHGVDRAVYDAYLSNDRIMPSWLLLAVLAVAALMFAATIMYEVLRHRRGLLHGVLVAIVLLAVAAGLLAATVQSFRAEQRNAERYNAAVAASHADNAREIAATYHVDAPTIQNTGHFAVYRDGALIQPDCWIKSVTGDAAQAYVTCSATPVLAVQD